MYEAALTHVPANELGVAAACAANRNELISFIEAPDVDAIEIYNPTPNAASIGGWERLHYGIVKTGFVIQIPGEDLPHELVGATVLARSQLHKAVRSPIMKQ